MSDTTSDQYGGDALADRSTIDVLYVAAGTAGTSVSADLEAEYGMDVYVATSLPEGLSLVAGDGDFDCVVTESSDTGAVARTLVQEWCTHRPAVPVVVYADAGDNPSIYRDHIDAGTIDYVPREVDTERRLLLARRIEHCVALNRERVKAGHFRAVVDQMGHGVLIADSDGQIEYANGAFETLGYAPGTLEGQPLSVLQSDVNEGSMSQQFWDAVTNGERWSGELAVSTPDGERIVDLAATPLRGDDGDIRRIIAVGDDVTERKQREQRFRSFRAAVEQAGHVIMFTDTDGYIEYVNPAFEEVTGYNREEALGERPALLKSGEHDEDVYEELWDTISSGEIWEGELVNERKSGERYHIRQTIAPVTDDEGQIERFVAVNTDITDRKRYEHQLERERDRLEEFARTIAHDLRNPLSIALGHIELAQNGNTTQSDALEQAIESLERMDALIDEVLTLSKQGQTIHQPEPASFVNIVERAWENVERPAATLSIEDDLRGWSVNADESRLCELLENLFRNAIEHAGPGVTVCVGCLPEERGFFVEDDGPGIPPENRNQVFEGGFTTAEDGTGFGLAIVSQIIDAHGWEIDVCSSPDGGARFEITTATTSIQATDGSG